MPIKIDVKLLALVNALPEIRAAFNKDVEPTLAAEIVQQIQSGTSPVKGQGRFKDYSDSYKDTIERQEGVVKGTDGSFWTEKKVRPVNLTVSGETLKSIQVKVVGDEIQVDFAAKSAAWHNGGNPKIPRRAILPTLPGEEFSTTLSRFLLDRAKRIVAGILNRNI